MIFYDPLRRVVVFEMNRFLVLLYAQCIENVAFYIWQHYVYTVMQM